MTTRVVCDEALLAAALMPNDGFITSTFHRPSVQHLTTTCDGENNLLVVNDSPHRLTIITAEELAFDMESHLNLMASHSPSPVTLGVSILVLAHCSYKVCVSPLSFTPLKYNLKRSRSMNALLAYVVPAGKRDEPNLRGHRKPKSRQLEARTPCYQNRPNRPESPS
jgi:hypothetical protein